VKVHLSHIYAKLALRNRSEVTAELVRRQSMAETHPVEPHYYLFLLGTRPEWQGRGLGSSLMAPVLQTCDRDRVPAYLEATSERNVPLYLRHGFDVTADIQVPGGQRMWPMWRTPK
jgi:GNAT superfamily N-acetyltransferase